MTIKKNTKITYTIEGYDQEFESEREAEAFLESQNARKWLETYLSSTGRYSQEKTLAESVTRHMKVIEAYELYKRPKEPELAFVPHAESLQA